MIAKNQHQLKKIASIVNGVVNDYTIKINEQTNYDTTVNYSDKI